MAAVEDADRLNNARRSGAEMDFVGNSVRIWAIIMRIIHLGMPSILEIERQGVDKAGHGNGSHM